MKLTRFALVLTLFWLTGCQAIMVAKSKNKETMSRDKFSCGEKLPGRMP